MPSIAKIVTITPLVRPEARSSPSPTCDVPLVPRNIPKESVSPSLYDCVFTPQASDIDVWARFSNAEGFHDENGFYYPPMDPEEIKQFAEKFFSPGSDSPVSLFDQDPLLSSLTHESEAIYDADVGFLIEDLDSLPSSSEEELDSFISATLSQWPLLPEAAEAAASSDAHASALEPSFVEAYADIMSMDTSS